MIEVVGIRFKKAGKVYYFDPDGNKFEKGSFAIVETARGVEYGQIVKPNTMVTDEEVFQPLKKVIRPANDNDAKQQEEDAKKEVEAFAICEEKIAKSKLDMKLVDVEITFDHNKYIFYFTSDGRVDFRELVKELASVFRTRIELRQIGVRDEAKMLNGIGICGRPLCCATFLGDFHPVSIKMAKEQNLSLNPTKISGICGRLMCCLKYEEEMYEELNKNLPNEGDIVSTPEGTGEILAINVLMQKVKAAVKKNENDAPTIGYYNVSDIKVIKTKKQKHKANNNDSNNSNKANNNNDNNNNNKANNNNDSNKANNNNDMLDMPLD
ncbi:MAG: stage 0 sporulation family protein [Clostridia bacterium]|jgi:cell fate regulator YaaT (PSP1 superfamily)|nr:stage 0 sporulation family protein [Clostridia bacterium]